MIDIQSVTSFAEGIASWLVEQFGAVAWDGVVTDLVGGLKGGVESALDGAGLFDSLQAQVSTLSSFFNEHLMPVFEAVADLVGLRLAPTFGRLKDAFAETGQIISSQLGPTTTQIQATFSALLPVLRLVASPNGIRPCHRYWLTGGLVVSIFRINIGVMPYGDSL